MNKGPNKPKRPTGPFGLHPEDFLRMMRELKEGKAVAYSSSKTFKPPIDAYPLDGFTYEINYPECCKTHTNIELFLNDWFDKYFPNSAYQELAKRDWFEKEDFKYVVSQTIDKINYFIVAIKTFIDTENWYYEIIDYYDYLSNTFGTHGIGYVPFQKAIQLYIKNMSFDEFEVTQKQRDRLLEYCLKTSTEEEKDEKELNLLINTYKLWLNNLPKVEYFESIIDQLPKGAPVASKKRYNKYLGLYKYTIRTKDELIDLLTEITKKILSQINTVELLNAGQIKDVTKTEIDLINQHHEMQQLSDLEQYDKGQMKYIKYLKVWLKNEKRYFASITPLLEKIKPNKKAEKKKDITFFQLFRGSEKDIQLFMKLLKRDDIAAIDHQSNWIYEGKKSSIVACFDVLKDLRTIKYMESKSELARVVRTVISFEGTDKIFRQPYNSSDYTFFENLFHKTTLNKH